MKVEGKRRLELHSKWIDQKSREIDEAISFLEKRQAGIMKVIMAEMCLDNKSRTVRRYKSAANKQRDRVVDSKHLVDITPWMEGSL